MIDKIIKISFVILIFSILFSGLLFFDFTMEVSKKENRTLAKFPKRSPFHEEFPKEFDEWVNDRVGFRELSIDLYNDINKKLEKRLSKKINVWSKLKEEYLNDLKIKITA